MFAQFEAIYIGTTEQGHDPPTALFYDPDSETCFTASLSPEQFKALMSIRVAPVPVVLSAHLVPCQNHDLTIQTLEILGGKQDETKVEQN